MSRIIVGLDIETYDPCLKTAGYSWKYQQGNIINTALYYEATDEKKVIPGIHYENCPYTAEQRAYMNGEICALLRNPEVSIVGANLQYDIGWLLYEYDMTTYDVKCRFIDVLAAEAILDEHHRHSLEEVSWKYLKYGKRKDAIEDWIQANVQGAKGDFRKYLNNAPWDLLCEYVLGDAENPVKVWRKQLTLLKEQKLCERTKIEFDCILPILQITMNGYPFDDEQRKVNCAELTRYRDMLKEQFTEQYGINLNVNSSRDIATFCEKRHIPYRCKVTLKGIDGHKFVSDEETDNSYNKAKKIVASFRLEKGVPVAYVPSELADRTVDLLEENDFMVTCSPNVDKKFFAASREQYPEIGVIADWKLCNGIISKILGEKYERFVSHDKDGVLRVHPQFNISNTLSFRLSSVNPNFQQIPSKGGFTVKENGEDKFISFPEMTRNLCKPEKDCCLFKIDYGQIEYRLICNVAVGEGSEEVRQEFADNPRLDFHQYVVDLTGLSRKYAKNMSFGVSFGMGLPSMAANFGWTMEQAEEISEAYHHHMPFVAPTLQLIGDLAKEHGYIKTVCGSHARLLSPKRAYTMLNRYTQGSGAEILKSSVIRAYKEGVWQNIKVHNTVHDELNFSVIPDRFHVEQAFRMRDIMLTTVPLKVPLIADIEIGMDWQHVKEVPEWIEIRDKDPVAWQSQPEPLRKTLDLCEEIMKERNEL